MPRQIQRFGLLKQVGASIEFSPDDRARIEAAYGRKLTPEQWVKITAATSLLTGFGGGIKSGARVADVLEKLQKLINAAKSLRQEFSKDALPDYGKSTLAAIHAKFFNDPPTMPGSGALPLLLIFVLEGTIAISEFMAEELNQPNQESSMIGFSEGEMWDIWIHMVTNIVKDSGFPYEARKDTDKRKSDSPSPFVALIRELQKSLPTELQKSNQSDDALAQAIYRARRGKCDDDQAAIVDF